jgi:2-polyprenyl-3-methyl-5-hydroxy-6-metoxy-1,4-benzoquinol methylase
METQTSEWRDQDKIRQQFDYGPYPRIPLDQSGKDDVDKLFQHNFVTAYYLHHRHVVDTSNRVILDAGCGTGYKSLVLAEANPGAKIVGIDLSEQSLQLARQRLQHHGFDNVEFHQLKIEDIGRLSMKFDYINCDEVLYILPDPAAGLRAMKAALKPDGLIRANLHNANQRACYYRAQELFKMMGLMDSAPGEFEEEAVIETMSALKDGTRLKSETWLGHYREELGPEKIKEFLAMNFLFVGDTGYTIDDLFSLLEQAELEFVSMVNWRQWDVTELFNEPDNLPVFWSASLATATSQEKLRLFNLINPMHRLLDFWCAYPNTAGTPVDDWSETDWQKAIVHLHPQLRTETMKDELIQCIKAAKPFEISQQVKLPTLAPVLVEASVAACLLPLWDEPQPIQALVERYRQIRPVDPVTLEPLTEATAFETVKDLLNRLDAFLYVLLERL